MGEGHLRERGRRGVTTTHMPNGDLLTGSGFVIPAQAHATYLTSASKKAIEQTIEVLEQLDLTIVDEENLVQPLLGNLKALRDGGK